MTTNTDAVMLAALQALIAGLQKQLPNQSYVFGNVTYTTATLVQVLQPWVDALTAANAAHQQTATAVSKLDAVRAKTAPLYVDVKRFLQSMYGTEAQTLGGFGLQPRKAAAPLTTEQRAAKAAKAAATRAARGTTSKKKKLAVTGNVSGVTITPVTTQPVATSPASPVAPSAATPPTQGGK